MQRLSGGHIDLIHTCIGSSIMVQSRVGRSARRAFSPSCPKTPPDTLPNNAARRPLPPSASRTAHPCTACNFGLPAFLYLAFLKKDFVVVEHMRLKLDGADDIGVKQVAAYQSSLKSM